MNFPNFNSLARIIGGPFWPGYDAPRHYYVYNPKSFSALAHQVGLQIQKIRYISRPSQFLGTLQYVYNYLFKKKVRLEDGFFRNCGLFDFLLYALCYILNVVKLGDTIEVYIQNSNITK